MGLLCIQYLIEFMRTYYNATIFATYILLVIMPFITVSVRLSFGGYSKTNVCMGNILYIANQVIIIAFPFIVSFVFGNQDSKGVLTGSFYFSAGLSIICVYLNHMIFIRNESLKIRSDIDKQMLNFTKHPVLNSRESINNVVESLFSLTHSKEIALQFFQDSIKQFETKGAVHIDVSFSTYMHLLGALLMSSNRVIGTFTTMPGEIRRNSNNKSVRDYLKIIGQHKRKIQRICVFEKKDIKNIKICSSLHRRKRNFFMYLQSVCRKSNAHHENGNDDIMWFEENVPAKDLKWDETQSFIATLRDYSSSLNAIIPPSQSYMVDFAIFNDDILLRWNADERHYQKEIDQEQGTIIMLIGENVKNLCNDMNKYMKSTSGYGSFEELHCQFENKG